MKPAFTKLVNDFYYVFDGRSKICRVKLKERKDGRISIAKFLPNKNEKLRSVLLEIEEVAVFNTLEPSQKAKFIFKKLDQ